MEIVSIPCPECGHQLQLRDRSLLGQAARCPECRHKFLLEERAEPRRRDDSLSGRETIAPGKFAESLAEPSAGHEPILKEFGRYQLLRELGQGAMGTVYLAHDVQLGREVALKIPKFGGNDDSELLERFYREARSAATLRHPNICPVFDVGEVDGAHYLTMAYIEGRTLSSYISHQSEKPERQVVGIVSKLASALEHAHQQGVVHRDLKPGNIMIDKRNDPIVMDFGLALQLEMGNDRLTQTGTILGTPAYMSPEQVRAEWDRVGPCSDVYSLGVILYELLTGEIPFDGPIGVVMARVLNEEPMKPSEFRADLDPRLESICLQMMAKEIDDRYASMFDVTAELTEFLKKRPQRPAKQSRTLPRNAELTPASEDSAATSGRSRKGAERPAAANVSARRTTRSAKKSVVSPTERRQRAGALFRTAQQCMEVYDYEQAIELLQQIPKANLNDDARELLEEARERQEEVTFLMTAIGKAASRQRHNDLRTHLKRLLEVKPGHRRARQAYKRLTSKKKGGGNQAARYWLGGIPERSAEPLHEEAYWRKWIIAGTAVFFVTSAVMWGVVTMYVNSNGESRSNVAGKTGEESRANLGATRRSEPPSNKIVETAEDEINSSGGTAQNVLPTPANVSTGIDEENAGRIERIEKPSLTLTGHTGPVSAVAFSPDGSRVASAGREDSNVSVLDVKTGRKLLSLKGHSYGVQAVVFSPDGQRIVSGSGDNTLKVWDAESGQEILTLTGHESSILSIAFSPDGRRIASGSYDKTLRVWDSESGRETLTLTGHIGVITSVAYSPDGRRIVGGGQGNVKPGELKVWDAESGKEILMLTGHTESISSVAFSPDGKRIVSGNSVEYSPDGQRIVGGGYRNGNDVRGELKVWDAESGKETLTFTGHRSFVNFVSFSPDGRRIISGSHDKTLKVWDAQSGKETLTLIGHKGSVKSASFSPDGQRIVSGSGDNTLKVWDALSGREMLSVKPNGGRVDCVIFGPDGRRIASGGWDDTLRVWDIESGRETLTLPGHTGSIQSVAFSPDGLRLVSYGVKYGTPIEMKVWDAESGVEMQTLTGHTSSILSVAYSPDGQRIVSGSRDKTLKVWDAESGVETLTLTGHGGPVDSASFSPDGRRIVSGSGDNTLKVWDAQSGKETLTLTGHKGSVKSASFSPNGQRIVSGSEDKTLKVWDVASGQEILTLAGHTGEILSVALSPDGRRIASGGYDGTLRLWDAVTGQKLLSVKASTEITCVAFSPDSSRIATTHYLDGTVKVWDISKRLPADAGPSVSRPSSAIAPFNEAEARIHQQVWAKHLGADMETTNSIGMKMVLIPPGEFKMGSPDSDSHAKDFEKPQHRVKITKPFYLAANEVTQSQYQKVMGVRPWQGKKLVQEGADYPATYVSWNDAVEFCRKLSAQEGVEYRLPTEAEWEYTCRAGTTTVYSFGNDTSQLGKYAWNSKNAWEVGEKYAHRVGQKLPNPWALFDMHGNVWELCQDWFQDFPTSYSNEKVVSDPMGPAQGKGLFARGGAYNLPTSTVRSAFRFFRRPTSGDSSTGFRPLRTYKLSP